MYFSKLQLLVADSTLPLTTHHFLDTLAINNNCIYLTFPLYLAAVSGT